MFHKIESVTALSDLQLSVLFCTGEKKTYDVRHLLEAHDAFKSFSLTHGLFEQVKVANGGYGIYWNDAIDISCNELYINGKGTM